MNKIESEKMYFKETLYFINEFGFNNDYLLEFLKYEVTKNYRRKPSVEMLRDRIRIYSKTNSIYRKAMATKKVLTDKNMKILKEASENRDNSFAMLITDLNEAHSFVTVLLKIVMFKRKGLNPSGVYNELIKDISSFNDLLKEIELEDKNETFILNNFNRVRNVLAHAPVNMIIEQVNELLLNEMLIISNRLIPIMNRFLIETKDLIHDVLVYREFKLHKDGVMDVTNVTEIAENNNITTKALLGLIRESSIETTDVPNIHMRIDSREASKIQPLIDKHKKEKSKSILEAKINSAKENILKKSNILLFEADEVGNLDFSSIDCAINFIYSNIKPLNIEIIIVIFNENKTHENKLVKEIAITTKKQVVGICKDKLSSKLKELRNNNAYYINMTTLRLDEYYSINESKVFCLKEVKILKEAIK